MAYWLLKSDPDTYSWADLLKDKKTSWDGIRNYQARNNVNLMKKGDKCLFYHSQKETQIVGLAEVTKEAYPDPTIEDPRWVSVEIKALSPLKKFVTLQQIKAEESLQNFLLIRHTRLSVIPVSDEEYNEIIKLSK